MRVLSILLLLCIAAPASAADAPAPAALPQLDAAVIDDPLQARALSLRCQPGDPGSLLCRYRALAVTPRLSSDQLAGETATRVAEVEREVAATGGIRRWCRRKFPEVSSFKTLVAEAEDKRGSRLPDSERDALLLLQDACSFDSRAKLDDWVRRDVDLEGRTCSVSVEDSETLEFRRSDADTWIARGSPEGDCKVTTDIRLRHAKAGWSAELETRYAESTPACAAAKVGQVRRFTPHPGDWRPLDCARIAFLPQAGDAQ